MPGLASDLVSRRANVIAAPSTPAALAAKTATSVIPIVFGVGDDPVKLGMVRSLSRPGGNATGINFVIAELVAKRLGLLRELVPAAARIAVLVNPADATRTATVVSEVEAAAHELGLQVYVFNASTISEIDAAFTSLERERTDALFVAPRLVLQPAPRPARPAGGTARDSRGLRSARLCRSGRTDELRHEPC